MRFNLGTLTEDQEWRLYQLKRNGQTRFALEYTPEKRNWDYNPVIFESENYDEVISKMKEHYQDLLRKDVSLITDFDTKSFYQIYDFSDHEDYAPDMKNLTIPVKDLNRLSFMLQLCTETKKTAKRSTKTTKEKT